MILTEAISIDTAFSPFLNLIKQIYDRRFAWMRADLFNQRASLNRKKDGSKRESRKSLIDLHERRENRRNFIHRGIKSFQRTN